MEGSLQSEQLFLGEPVYVSQDGSFKVPVGSGFDPNTPRRLPGWFARLRGGVAYAVGTWQAMARPGEGQERVSALPKSDPSWTAAYIVDKVMVQGEETHAHDSWLREMTFEQHLDAARRHLRRIGKGGVTLSKDGQEDHLNNALCRLAMAVELRRRDPTLG